VVFRDGHPHLWCCTRARCSDGNSAANLREDARVREIYWGTDRRFLRSRPPPSPPCARRHGRWRRPLLEVDRLNADAVYGLAPASLTT